MPSDSVIDSAALNFPTGQFGTCINGQTFQQEALLSWRGWQYASYFADGGVLCLARRRLPEGVWEVMRFDYRIDHTDAHNVAVIGICPVDGTIHLSFDHHCHPLRYRRSIVGLATEPATHAWTPALFGATTNALEPGKPLDLVTYPNFFATPDGRLQLLYRLGYSGDGDWHMAEYDGATGAWSDLGMLISRVGAYKHSVKRCAYPNPLRYAPDGRLHLTWCWREGVPPRNLTTNHDLQYAVSDDCGRTWRNNTGAVVGVPGAGRPMAIDTPGLTVRETPFLWGQMNTTTQYTDHQGRVHVIHWQNPSEAPASNMDMNAWRYSHYWRGIDGVWHENRLPFSGRKPQMLLDRAGTAHVVFCASDERNYHGSDHGGVLTIARASAVSEWTDWSFITPSTMTSVGEPLVDPLRWEAEGLLSIYTQEKPVKSGAASTLHVFDIKPN